MDWELGCKEKLPNPADLSKLQGTLSVSPHFCQPCGTERDFLPLMKRQGGVGESVGVE